MEIMKIKLKSFFRNNFLILFSSPSKKVKGEGEQKESVGTVSRIRSIPETTWSAGFIFRSLFNLPVSYQPHLAQSKLVAAKQRKQC